VKIHNVTEGGEKRKKFLRRHVERIDKGKPPVTYNWVNYTR